MSKYKCYFCIELSFLLLLPLFFSFFKFNCSNWWSEAQEKKHLASDPRDTKVKKKLRDLKLQPGFPNPVVAQAYLHPTIDQSGSSFSWGRPQLDMIKEYPFSVCGNVFACFS